MASEQKAHIVAGNSKSPKDKEKSDNVEDADGSPKASESDVSATESSDDAPVVIEGEAVEIVAEDASSEAKDHDATADAEPEEVQPDEAPETTPPLPQRVEPAAQSAGMPVLALVFGGIVAGAIGYFGAALAPKPQAPEFDSTELSASIAANETALSELETSIAALQAQEAPAVDLSGIEGGIATLSQSVEGLTGDIAALRTRLDETAAEIESRATALDERIVALETAVPGAGELATADELAALRTRIEDMMSEAETRLAEAQAEADEIARAAAETRAAAEAEALRVAEEAAAREAEIRALAERQAALVDLKAAVDTGAEFAGILPQVGEAPEALAANAEAGVPTLQSLQQSFPAAARRALSASVTVPEDASAGERLAAFLKKRTNARSLTPQEGDGADAVLSRAEARLGEGDLAAALSELEALPEAGQAALGAWLEDARARRSAIEALDELTATN